MKRIIHGDMLAILPTLDENSVDAVITDPPYHLYNMTNKSVSQKVQAEGQFKRLTKGFMGKSWDGGDIAFRPETWRHVLRVLKPGGHIAVFGGTRTHHRLWVAIEDAGFEIRDSAMFLWAHGQGFPKSLDVSKAIDQKLGADRDVVGVRHGAGMTIAQDTDYVGFERRPCQANYRADLPITAPATPQAQQWQGWHTALKPSYEPILLARKPLEGTVAENILKHGVGALNIDACRVGIDGGTTRSHQAAYTGGRQAQGGEQPWRTGHDVIDIPQGRWPANLILDEGIDEPWAHYFYTAKASKAEREFGLSDINPQPRDATRKPENVGSDNPYNRASPPRHNNHPTVKPLSLMRYLTKLITPPGGVVLDPFTGSGTTGIAALSQGFGFIGIELDADYIDIAEHRIAAHCPDWLIPQ